MNWANPLRIP